MDKLVLDTNVLISGTYWTGASHQVLRLIDQKKARLILTPAIISEYFNVINRAEIIVKTTEQQKNAAKAAARKLIQNSDIIQPTTKISAILEDPEDNKIIEAAHAVKADYIITQDHHLLKIKRYQSIAIITPEQYLQSRR